ncbi:MAG: TPM domain-containing protein [Candidatus Woesearchaeota archaeon]
MHSIPAFSQQIAITGFVNDYANALTPEQEAALTALLAKSYDANLAQIAVVIIPSLEGKDITHYALELAQGNLGDSQKNNGLLLLIALEERAYRFEVGRGLEPIFNDAKVGRIGRQLLVPAFRQGKYYQGIEQAILALNAELGIEGGPMPEGYDGSASSQQNSSVQLNPLYLLLFGVLFFLLMFVQGYAQAKTRVKQEDDKTFFAALVLASLLRPPRGGFGGGGLGRGGFGGGGFGGGGAGGSW